MEARLESVSGGYAIGYGTEYVPAVVNVGAAAQKKVLDGLETIGSLVTRLVNVELGSTVLHSLLSLRLGAGEDNNVVAHGGSQLDG
jgi:hypothetical protein